MREFTGNMPPQKLGAGFVREGHLARAIHSHSMREFTGMPRPRSHSMQEFIIGKRCAPEARSRHAHGHLMKAILCENLQEKTEEVEHAALTSTVRTLQCGHTVWGKKLVNLCACPC